MADALNAETSRGASSVSRPLEEVLSGGGSVLKEERARGAESQQTELRVCVCYLSRALCRLAVDVQTDEPSEEAGAPMLS